MTNKKANEIFRTKYPNGQIFAKGTYGGISSSKYAVIFDTTKEHCKAYGYFELSYTGLLNRFGLIED